MPTTTSPLDRLTQVIDFLHTPNEITQVAPTFRMISSDIKINTPGQITQISDAVVGDVLCLMLGQTFPGVRSDGFDAASRHRAYLMLTDLTQDAHAFVYHSSRERARSLNLQKLASFQKYVTAHHALSPISAFRNPFLEPSVVEELHALSDNLANHNAENVISTVEQEEMRTLLSALTDKLMEADIDPLLKARMFSLLEEIQAVITRLKFVSPEELIARLDRFMGIATVAAVSTLPEKNKSVSDFFTSTVTTVGQIVTLVDHAKKLAPALVALAAKFHVLGF